MDCKKTLFLAMGIAGLLAFALVFSCSFGEDDDDDDDDTGDDDDFSPEDDDDDDNEPNPLVEGWNDVCECADDTIPAASVDSEDQPWIAFVSGDDQVKVAYHDQEQWLSSTITGVSPSAQDPIAMVLDPGDNPHLLFRLNTTLYYATLNDKSWNIESLTTSSADGYDISYSNNTPLVAYYKSGGKSFVYAARSSSSWESFDLETESYPAGGGCSIGADLADYPVIAYVWGDQIRIATWPGGSLTQETLLENEVVGDIEYQYDMPRTGYDSSGGHWCCYYSFTHDIVQSEYRIGIDCQVKTGLEWNDSDGTPYINEFQQWPRYFTAWLQRSFDVQYIGYSVDGVAKYAYHDDDDWQAINTNREFSGSTNAMGIAAAEDGTVYMVLNDGGELTLMMKLPE